MDPTHRLNQETAAELFKRIPANTSLGDIITTISRIPEPERMSVDELIVEINHTTECRIERSH